mgnify:CR=1 FL=1
MSGNNALEQWRTALVSDQHRIPVVAIRQGRVHHANAAARSLHAHLDVGMAVEELFDEGCREKAHTFLREGVSGSTAELEVTRVGGPPIAATLLLLEMPGETLLLEDSIGIGYTEEIGTQLMAANAELADLTRELAKARDLEHLQRTWLRNAIEQMPDAVLLYNEQGGLKAANQGAAALSGEDPGHDPFGNPVVVQLRGLDGSVLPDSHWPIVRVLRNHEAIVREEMLVRRRTGEMTPAAVSAGSFRDATGNISGVIVTVQDLSDRKELERLREEWAAVVAHDLRQPVNTIGLAVESLLRHPVHELPDRDRRALERIARASKRLNRMVNDLLDASRIESNRLTIECQPVDLATLVDAAVDGLEDVIAGHEVCVTVGAECVVWIDPDRIHQVLGNLISNAVKYGSSETSIRVEAIPRDDSVEVIVTNEGPGIAADELPLLFRRFTRARGARECRRPGIGLGLYIARGLIEAHGGRLWAESTPGETTSFHFTVPRPPRLPQLRGEATSHAPPGW